MSTLNLEQYFEDVEVQESSWWTTLLQQSTFAPSCFMRLARYFFGKVQSLTFWRYRVKSVPYEEFLVGCLKSEQQWLHTLIPLSFGIGRAILLILSLITVVFISCHWFHFRVIWALPICVLHCFGVYYLTMYIQHSAIRFQIKTILMTIKSLKQQIVDRQSSRFCVDQERSQQIQNAALEEDDELQQLTIKYQDLLNQVINTTKQCHKFCIDSSRSKFSDMYRVNGSLIDEIQSLSDSIGSVNYELLTKKAIDLIQVQSDARYLVVNSQILKLCDLVGKLQQTDSQQKMFNSQLALVISQIEQLMHTCRSLQQSHGDNQTQKQHANQMDIEYNQDPLMYCADKQEVSSARSIHAVKNKRMSDVRIRKQASSQTYTADSSLNVHKDLMAELINALPAFKNSALEYC
ncbi:hypothetical protein MP228_006570 [Amoeboaphelidium protococcarum]|nr:hypothetical protein MP228_006570 [Amoeboaphelidium protococcarum]